MNMRRIAKFHKVSREQFAKGWKDTFDKATEAEIQAVYDSIQLPKRATAGSAGYDFYSPLSFELKPGETVKIPTGVRAEMDEGWVLKLYPRSGLGFNTVCSSTIQLALSTAIIFTQTMRAISL